MNCQEMMDDMQRHLDGDLDEAETAILMNHTRHCSDCAAMFERLKLLSAGLENLPKVVPSYSLVDAILPKLANIRPSDSEASDSKAFDSEPSVPVPHIVIGGVDATPPPRRSKPSGGSWRRWIPFTAGGGIVAAGVLIGMFFISNQGMHSVNDNAGNSAVADAANTGNSSANSIFSSSNTSDDSASSESTSTAPASQPEEKSDVRTQGSSSDDSVHGGQLPKALNQSVDPNGEPMPPITAGAQDRTSAAPNEMGPNQSSITANSGNAAAEDGANSGTASDGGAPAGAAANGSSSTDTSSAATADSGSGGSSYSNATASNGQTNAGGNSQKNITGTMAIMASPISPNQQYQAFIVDGAVVVYTVSDSSLVFQGDKRSGVSDLKWSDDSKQLTYEAVRDDGSKTTYVVDPQAGTEQTQSSK